jgi:hypothetical protein
MMFWISHAACQSLQYQLAVSPISYLGLLLTIIRLDRECFMPLIEKLDKDLWSGRANL